MDVRAAVVSLVLVMLGVVVECRQVVPTNDAPVKMVVFDYLLEAAGLLGLSAEPQQWTNPGRRSLVPQVVAGLICWLVPEHWQKHVHSQSVASGLWPARSAPPLQLQVEYQEPSHARTGEEQKYALWLFH